MITVSTGNATFLNRFDIQNATAWFIDDWGNLHLSDATKKPVASFSAGQWVSVERDGSGYVSA